MSNTSYTNSMDASSANYLNSNLAAHRCIIATRFYDEIYMKSEKRSAVCAHIFLIIALMAVS